MISEKVATPCGASWQTRRFALPFRKSFLAITLTSGKFFSRIFGLKARNMTAQAGASLRAEAWVGIDKLSLRPVGPTQSMQIN